MTTEQQSRNLDVIRACAVLSVFIGHGLLTLLTHADYVIGGYARFGVMVFFVHTSFVLMESLGRLEADGGGSVTARFYTRRFFRIYPLSVVAVLAAAAFHIPQAPWKSIVPPTARIVGSNLLLVQNLTQAHDILVPLWSLPFEVQMYLLLPLLYVAVTRWKVNPLALAGVCVLASLPVFPRYFAGIIAYFPCFLAGVAAYRISRNRKGTYSIAVLLVSMFLIATAYSLSRTYLRTYKPTWIYLESVTDWLCSLSIGLLLPYIREMKESRLSKAAHQIAKYSYGVYLSHIIVMWFAWTRMAGSPPALRILVFVAGSVGVPVLAFHLLENPAIELGKRIAKRLRKPRPIAVSQAA